MDEFNIFYSNTSVGEKIKRIRKARNMTQKELGEKLGGISQQQIGQWENGIKNPKIDTLKKIADALNVSIADLMSLEDFKTKPIVDVYHLHKIFENLANKPYGYSENEKKEMAIKINDHINRLEEMKDEDERIAYHKATVSTLTHEILEHLLLPYSNQNIEDIVELIAFYLQLNWDTKDLVIKIVENLYGNEKLRVENEDY